MLCTKGLLYTLTGFLLVASVAITCRHASAQLFKGEHIAGWLLPTCTKQVLYHRTILNTHAAANLCFAAQVVMLLRKSNTGFLRIVAVSCLTSCACYGF